jgi:hypothetical protein
LYNDTNPGEVSYSIFLATTEDTPLYMIVSSHRIVELMEMLKAKEEKGDITGDKVESIIKSLPSSEVFKVILQSGDMMVFHGNLIHAGAEGRGGLLAHSPRLQWYLRPSTVNNTTHLLDIIDTPRTASPCATRKAEGLMLLRAGSNEDYVAWGRLSTMPRCRR